jgi:hypothetical protein
VTKNVALFNLVVQATLIAGVFAGTFLARTRRFGRHCLIMRVLMGVQILLIGIIMAPQFARYVSNWSGFSAFTVELIIHHVLGLVALALWIYLNLALTGAVRAPRSYTWFMRSALVSWVASLGLGVYGAESPAATIQTPKTAATHRQAGGIRTPGTACAAQRFSSPIYFVVEMNPMSTSRRKAAPPLRLGFSEPASRKSPAKGKPAPYGASSRTPPWDRLLYPYRW